MPPTRRSLMTGALVAPMFAAVADRPALAATSLLRYGLVNYPPNFLPWEHSGTSARTVNVCVRRSLLSYDARGELRGELAEHWEVDGEAWHFHLRDAQFHNGKPVTADDVKWSIAQMAASNSTAYLRGSMQQITAIEIPDNKTVRLITKQPVASLPYWFAMPEAPIISRDSPNVGAGAVGAGPFVMTSSERGVSVHLAPFPKFYRPGLPKLKELRMTAYSDDNLRVSALQSGTLDMIEYVPWQSMTQIAADHKLKMQVVNGPFMYLVFNGAQGPFKNPKVRQAIAYGLNREDVVKAAFYGHAAPLGGVPLAENSRYYDAKLANAWNYDPARAKKLLKEAGLGGGFSCTLLSTVTDSMAKSTAEVVQANLASIGVQVQLDLPEWDEFLSLANRGQYQFAVGGFALDNNDPDSLSSLLDGSEAPSYTRSWHMDIPQLTKLLAEGRSKFKFSERKPIYDQVQQIAVEQVPVCFLVSRAQAYAMQPDVHGFHNLPGQLTFYSGYTLSDTYLI